jgi:Domain of unknown function (DUF1127)
MGILGLLEAAMNISTYGDQCASQGGLSHVLTDWWQQLRSRHELESPDDALLQDIGLTRGKERSKGIDAIFDELIIALLSVG